MQQTYQINTESLDTKFLETIKALFGKREVKIVIEDVQTQRAGDQRELFRSMEELRVSLKHIKVDPNIDLSTLANEVNDTPL